MLIQLDDFDAAKAEQFGRRIRHGKPEYGASSMKRGWSIEATTEELAEVSTKAKERVLVKEDKGYARLTARNAAAALERDRGRRCAGFSFHQHFPIQG